MSVRIRPSSFGRKSLLAGLLSGLAIFLLVQWIAYVASEGLVETSEAVADSQRVLLSLEEIVTEVQDAQRGQRGYVITGDERYLDVFHRAANRIPREIDDLRQLTAETPVQQQQLRELEQLVAQALLEFQEIIDARKAHGFPAAQQLVLAVEGKKAMDDMRRLVTQMQDQLLASLEEKEQAAKTAAARVPLVMLGGTAISFSLLLTVFYLLNQEIARRRQAQERIDALNTELEKRLRELATTNKELEATNKELEAFTYSVSHDLRAPLRHVDGFSRILVEEFGPGLDPIARRYLERMQKGVRNMAQ
ncbi:MAG: CHASE3 domain-containing protein, partial [Acidobacteria bacterium]|nr:CHASE3 domain-containing protein [Acidobacteriota bacterium]